MMILEMMMLLLTGFMIGLALCGVVLILYWLTHFKLPEVL